jgi:competence protein ComFC
MFQDFLALIYPRNCVACSNYLFKHENQICNYCYLNLPKPHFHQQAQNPLEDLFYGRVNVEFAASYYLFHKKGNVQKLLHAIKYTGNKQLARLLGVWFGKYLSDEDKLKTADYILPVPLHEKKMKQRGYNQSEEFAKGLSEILNLKIDNTCLKRKNYTMTQTSKSKYERWENVEDVFVLNNPDVLKNKHIVLVDDVITTGATLEACCNVLNKVEGIKISLLSIACATK